MQMESVLTFKCTNTSLRANDAPGCSFRRAKLVARGSEPLVRASGKA